MRVDRHWEPPRRQKVGVNANPPVPDMNARGHKVLCRYSCRGRSAGRPAVQGGLANPSKHRGCLAVNYQKLEYFLLRERVVYYELGGMGQRPAPRPLVEQGAGLLGWKLLPTGQVVLDSLRSLIQMAITPSRPRFPRWCGRDQDGRHYIRRGDRAYLCGRKMCSVAFSSAGMVGSASGSLWVYGFLGRRTVLGVCAHQTGMLSRRSPTSNGSCSMTISCGIPSPCLI